MSEYFVTCNKVNKEKIENKLHKENVTANDILNKENVTKRSD